MVDQLIFLVLECARILAQLLHLPDLRVDLCNLLRQGVNLIDGRGHGLIQTCLIGRQTLRSLIEGGSQILCRRNHCGALRAIGGIGG